MSNPLAVAAVTLTVQAILNNGVSSDPDLSDTTVTILPPDKARGNNNANQLNLFLYQILPNAAWRNMNIPGQLASGETGTPPLALTLHYLLTAFGRDNDTTLPYGHHLLGKAMSVLYDHALLGPDEIRTATTVALPGSDLDKQVERVRITLQPMTLEEISRLWTGLVTQYRLSVGYEVSVALIDSTQARRTPLPVLTRGPGDSGIRSQASLLTPFPSLDGLAYPNSQTCARLGDILTLSGTNLDGSDIGIVFSHPLWSSTVELAPLAGATPTQMSVQIPNSPAVWPAGFYTVTVLVQKPGESFRRATNQISFPLAPRISVSPGSAPGPSVTYSVTATPEIWPSQFAALLFGDQEVVAPPRTAQSGTLAFTIQDLSAGEYFVRLRVDGVDSILINRAVTPPAFDQTQKVSVT